MSHDNCCGSKDLVVSTPALGPHLAQRNPNQWQILLITSLSFLEFLLHLEILRKLIEGEMKQRQRARLNHLKTSARLEETPDSGSWRKIHIEPTLPIYLKFEEVKYKIAAKGEKNHTEKCIVQGITGSVHPGEVLALMGPSGGGKTTLLNLLSGRVIINSGIITYNDQPYTKSLKQRCQNTIIGGAFVRRISGGGRKRVCIGNEILLNPSLLFLDEPTSGLDSTTALRIVQMVHKTAEAGKTVATTIHQPSSGLFRRFDELILLDKGSSLYFGKISEAMLYFSSIGCAPLLAMNPAEFLIDLANGNIKDKSVPSDLEDKFFPGSQTLEIQDKRPSSPIDVHEGLLN
ncbi:hypothetical protein F0562_006538 [Nyssa sinensis]|uniref:ABC transporter domain-containing protein n=1 Tax=Nyssa sinensis TaxID=561372 RepID=A0A5J5AL10_9ASTE|nr:hypothetical protein F0562_006538 [Nyssa sinensis]